MIGEGWTGICTANEISDFGFEVLLIEENNTIAQDSEFWVPSYFIQKQDLQKAYKEVHQNEQIEYLPGWRLNNCAGRVGNFSVELTSDTEKRNKTVGAIVLALESRAVPLFETYGLANSKNVISLFELQKIIDTDEARGRANGFTENNKQIAILYGFAQEGNILGQRRLMDSVAKLEEQGFDSYIYTNNLKVAEKDLEELYKDNRSKGATYFKLQQKPDIFSDNTISHYDPILLKEVNLSPDTIVVGENIRPNPTSDKLSDILGLEKSVDNFLQENNIHRLAVSTNRSGIFTVGTCRDIKSFSSIESDAANVAISLISCFDRVKALYATSRGFVDNDKCCYCLTCYRSCPHGAIRLEDKPVISSFDCQACGICASECPQEAITIVDVKWEEIKTSITGALKKTKNDQPPRIIAYCCQNSAYEAGMAANMFDRPLPPGLETKKVPCAGSINLDLILSALQSGADGVLVLGCHPEACKSVKGNTFAYWRTERLRTILEEVGFSRDRIRFETLAENMDFEFSKYALEMEKDLKGLGPNPLKQQAATAAS